MKSSDTTPLLVLDGGILNSMPSGCLDLKLYPRESRGIVLPDVELSELDHVLTGSHPPAGGRVSLLGHDPNDDESWTKHLAGKVAMTFSPILGRGAWLENLAITENILLAQTMHGATPAATQSKALLLAKRFGIDSLPETRPSATPREILTVCQWVRAFLVDDAVVFLMIDPLRFAPDGAMEGLLEVCAERREKGAAFLWLLSQTQDQLVSSLQLDSIASPQNSPLGL